MTSSRCARQIPGCGRDTAHGERQTLLSSRKWLETCREKRILQGGGFVKKILLKRVADSLEKLAVGSSLIGIFKQDKLGIYVALGCFVASLLLTALEARLK